MNTYSCFSQALIHNNGALHYMNVWTETEEKNVSQIIGQVLIWHRKKGPLWGMNYDGWQKNDEKINDLRSNLLIKTLSGEKYFQRSVSGSTVDGLLYQNEIEGGFQLFEIKTSIFPNNDHVNPVTRFTYHGRALVNLGL